LIKLHGRLLDASGRSVRVVPVYPWITEEAVPTLDR
jgi:hypothetical protein